jgi:hypothetical protein
MLMSLTVEHAEGWIKDYDYDLQKVLREPALLDQFIGLVHEGFWIAQDLAVQVLVEEGARDAQKAQLYRHYMDVIAWQLIDNQLYIARRLFRRTAPPSLQEANLKSVRHVACDFGAADQKRFALLTDLTSFVQVGDLLTKYEDGAIGVIEVKEGEVNSRILRFLESLASTECPYSIKLFRDSEGEKTFNQLTRVVRQRLRGAHVEEVVNTGAGVDPDTGEHVIVRDVPVTMSSWESKLVELLEESNDRGWAIAHIENCLFVGVYRENMRLAGELIFRGWLEHCTEDSCSPIANLMDGIVRPLALPHLLWALPREQKLDILFGRAVVWLGLDMNSFMSLCNESSPVRLRWASRKETGKLRDRYRSKVWTQNNRAILIESGGQKGVFGDAIGRIFFHAATPRSAIEGLRASLDLRSTTIGKRGSEPLMPTN